MSNLEEGEPEFRATSRSSVGFFVEAWLGFRPYLLKMIVDFFISAFLWFFLFLFHWLTIIFKIDNWAGKFIVEVHSVGVILAFVLFGLLFTLDVIAINKEKLA
jgi:hypothetical protein